MKKETIDKIMELLDECYHDGLCKSYKKLGYFERIESCKKDILRLIRKKTH